MSYARLTFCCRKKKGYRQLVDLRPQPDEIVAAIVWVRNAISGGARFNTAVAHALSESDGIASKDLHEADVIAV
jgi:hypothetical protein